MALLVIRNKANISTKKLAEKIERSPRTLQRYIETLRSAGEFIGYDRQKKTAPNGKWKITFIKRISV